MENTIGIEDKEILHGFEQFEEFEVGKLEE